MRLLIRKADVRRFALEKAKLRHHKFTRISKEFIENCDAQLRVFIEVHINSLPSKGKTIY
jgi:hypothetical protein